MTDIIPLPVHKRVLVVDDATIVRLYYRQALERHGFTVEEAFNGLEALEKVLTDGFDLILCDVNMPKMDGYSFIRRLRATEGSAATPVLMTSTQDQKRDADAAREAGANLYLVKPIAENDLAAYAAAMTGVAVQ